MNPLLSAAWLLFVTLILAACGPSDTATPQVAPTESSTATASTNPDSTVNSATTDAASAETSDLPQVRFVTNYGAFTVELNALEAPETVANFLRYVDNGFYHGTLFHRVIDGFMIQGGGFTADYQRKQTFDPILNEADNALKNLRGSIAMARTSSPHSATAQFFVNLVDNAFLNHRNKSAQGWGYTVFGRVVEGMSTVDQIAKVSTGAAGPFRQDAPAEQVIIESATRVTD